MANDQRFILDTDAVVDVLRGRRDVALQLATKSPDEVGVTTMTVAELRFGASRSRDPQRNGLEVSRFLEQVRVLAFGRRAAAHHAAIRSATRAQPVGPNDLVVAATALAAGATLVTSHTKEYVRVPDLVIEDWRAGSRVAAPSSAPSPLGESRRSQLISDLALSVEDRVRAAEETARASVLLRPPIARRVLTFDRYEDYLAWKRQDDAGR